LGARRAHVLASALSVCLVVVVALGVGSRRGYAQGGPVVITVDEPIATADSIAPRPGAVVTVEESVAVAADESTVPPALVTLTEAIAVDAGVLFVPPAIVAISEDIVTTDTAALVPTAVITVDEAIAVADAPLVVQPAIVIVDETIVASDGAEFVPPISISVNEAIALDDAPAVLPPAIVSLDESVRASDIAALVPPAVVAVDEPVADDQTLIPPATVSVVEAVTAADTLALVPPAVINLGEGVAVADSLTANVVVPLRPVGRFAVTPTSTSVHAGERTTYVVTCSVPAPLNWRDLATVDLRFRHGEDTILWVRFAEATRTVSVFHGASDQFGPDFPPGSPNRLETEWATLHLTDMALVGSGPTGPSVDLTLDVSFKPLAAGSSYLLEIGASDDSGTVQDFAPAAVLVVAGPGLP
jgi:hypothetical protein